MTVLVVKLHSSRSKNGLVIMQQVTTSWVTFKANLVADICAYCENCGLSVLV